MDNTTLHKVDDILNRKTDSVLLSRNYDPLQNLFPSDFIKPDQIKDFIPFGEDNLLPQQIAELSRAVTVHRSIINSKSAYLSGTGLSTPNNKLSAFLASFNKVGDNLHSVLSKAIFDDIQFGNAWIEIVSDSNFSYVQTFHVDATTVRLSADEPNTAILHPNWREYDGIKDEFRSTLPIYPIFEQGNDDQIHSILHFKTYEPEFSNYGLPQWYAGLSSVIIAGLADQWNVDRLESQFNGEGMLVIPGVNSDPDRIALQSRIDNFTGAANNPNSNNLLVQFLADLGPGQVRDSAQYIQFKPNTESQWILLYSQSHNNLLSIHNWFKTLCSFYGEKTGFDTHRIINEYEIALNTIIKQFQTRYLSVLSPILQFFNFNPEQLDFENQPPVFRISPVSYVWEVRRDAGQPYDKTDPRQKVFFAELQNTFTSETDNKNSGPDSKPNA